MFYEKQVLLQFSYNSCQQLAFQVSLFRIKSVIKSVNMDNTNEEALLLCIVASCTYVISTEGKKRVRRKRKEWVKPWIAARDQKGTYQNLLNELRLQDKESYRHYLRMNTATFDELLARVGPTITKKTTCMRIPISPEEKLAVTIRFLATGESFESLQYQYRIHRTTIAQFVPEVCFQIYKILKDEYLSTPCSKEEWETIARRSEERWQFPNCIGACDGKHIAIKHPDRSGSEFYNYKGFFSIVLLAIVNYDYEFIYVDVGCQGRISDGGVFRHSSFYSAIENNTLNLPEPAPLPISSDPTWEFYQENVEVPYIFVADDAFPLGMHCMKPFAQTKLVDRNRVFNYRLSRMRQLSENVFGIWVSRFRVFLTTIALSPEKATIITLAAIVLHNMLRRKSRKSYTPDGCFDTFREGGEKVPGTWCDEVDIDFLRSLPSCRSNRAPESAEEVRNALADYFYGPGQVPWQWKLF